MTRGRTAPSRLEVLGTSVLSACQNLFLWGMNFGPANISCSVSWKCDSGRDSSRMSFEAEISRLNCAVDEELSPNLKVRWSTVCSFLPTPVIWFCGAQRGHQAQISGQFGFRGAELTLSVCVCVCVSFLKQQVVWEAGGMLLRPHFCPEFTSLPDREGGKRSGRKLSRRSTPSSPSSCQLPVCIRACTAVIQNLLFCTDKAGRFNGSKILPALWRKAITSITVAGLSKGEFETLL